MTRAEFEGWKAVTARSVDRWQIDLIQYYNRGEYLFYKGGQNGDYVEVDAQGKVTMGSYEGALPHIHEATFTIMSTKEWDSQEVALKKLFAVVPEMRYAVTGLTGRV